MRVLLLCFCLAVSLHATAQEEWCGSKHDNAPILFDNVKITPRSVLTIPVVFHIVWHDSIDNIPDERIYSQMQVLNTDFRKLNEDLQFAPAMFKAISADMEIEFCLASIDPFGNPSSGITRTNTSSVHIGSGTTGQPVRDSIKHSNLGGKDAWDNKKYLNIWVGKFKESTGVLGISTYPWENKGTDDGIRVDPKYVGINCTSSKYKQYSYGRTITHEIGHYFGLEHPFKSPCEIGDNVDDTPKQCSQYGGCEQEITYDPSGEIPMLSNFMQYVDDRCMSMFTVGQKERVWSSIYTYRPELLSQSVACNIETRDPILKESSIKAYPNPVTSCLMLELDIPYTSQVQVQLYNMSGRLFYNEDMPSIAVRPLEIGYLPGGIYLLKINSGSESVVKKIMVL